MSLSREQIIEERTIKIIRMTGFATIVMVLFTFGLTMKLAFASELNTCTIKVVNQHSVHDGTKVIVNSDAGQFVLNDVEEYKGKITEIKVSYYDYNSISRRVVPGSSGLSSVNAKLLNCEQSTSTKPPVETTPEPVVETTEVPALPNQETVEEPVATIAETVDTEQESTTGSSPKIIAPASNKAAPAVAVVAEPSYTG